MKYTTTLKYKLFTQKNKENKKVNVENKVITFDYRIPDSSTESTIIRYADHIIEDAMKENYDASVSFTEITIEGNMSLTRGAK